MVELGKWNHLEVLRICDTGAFVDGGESGDILLPAKYMPGATSVGDYLDLFIYRDSEDRIIATTLKPTIEVDQISNLRVIETGTMGAFLDWGLLKDLLLPYSEQRKTLVAGDQCLVRAYVDNSGRIAASMRIERFLKNGSGDFCEGEEVSLILFLKTPLGYKAVINGVFEGLVFHQEILKPVLLGKPTIGYIKKLREDGKIDLTLEKPGYEKIASFSDQILLKLKESDGFLAYHDKSEAEDIRKVFQTSKKNFKKAIGALYRNKKIDIKADGIYLL